MENKKNKKTQDIKKKDKIHGLSKYNPDIHPKLAKVARDAGYTDTEIAKIIGVSRSNLNIWREKYKAMEQALSDKKYYDNKVVDALYTHTQGGYYYEDHVVKYKDSYEVIQIKKYLPPNVTAQIFWLKNRQSQDWKDRQDLNIDANIDYKEQRRKLTEIFKKVNIGKQDL